MFAFQILHCTSNCHFMTWTKVKFFSFVYRYPIGTASFVETTIFAHKFIVSPLHHIKFHIFMMLFWYVCSVLLIYLFILANTNFHNHCCYMTGQIPSTHIFSTVSWLGNTICVTKSISPYQYSHNNLLVFLLG